MNIYKFGNKLLAIGVLAILAAIGSLMNSRQSVLQAQATGGPTVTINPAQLPLRVTGSTAVSGTVAATQSGVWNVGIGGNSVSSPLFTRDADSPARQPFQIELCEQAALQLTPPPCIGASANYTVPSDRRLAIEFVSGSCEFLGSTGPNGLFRLGARLVTTAGGYRAQYAFPLVFFLGEVTLAQQTRIYADPGTTVNFSLTSGLGPAPVAATCVLTISGDTITPP